MTPLDQRPGRASSDVSPHKSLATVEKIRAIRHAKRKTGPAEPYGGRTSQIMLLCVRRAATPDPPGAAESRAVVKRLGVRLNRQAVGVTGREIFGASPSDFPADQFPRRCQLQVLNDRQYNKNRKSAHVWTW